MFYNNAYYKTVDTNNKPDNCDLYWDDYRIGTVCYTYNADSDRTEVVYHKKEIAHIPEVLVRKFFNIPSMSDLQKHYKEQDIQDTYNLLSKTRD